MENTLSLQTALSHSADMVKKLGRIITSGLLSQTDLARINKQLTDMQNQADAIDSTLQQITNQYKEAEGSAKQQLWERKLLDFSMHNSLLNMRQGKNAFAFPVDDISALEDEMHEGGEQILENKELRHIYRSARTNMEEMGANTLFLTLGTLNWTEDNRTHKAHKAPILLMPVEMVSLGKDRFSIRKRDDEMVLNITLLEFLKQTFSIDLGDINPLPKDEHGVDVSYVIHRFHEAAKEMPDWSVDEDSVLGIFSFTKFVIWNDIHSHPEVMTSNPVLRSLIEGHLVMADVPNVVDAREMDTTAHPDVLAMPLDGDSSQVEAIMDAAQGRTFCLYGPPGTGKSQSITNMIANAMYRGQRVLFVAQKKAALEVVQNRLTKIGLGQFCLELHSNKIDKKHFLDQMQRILDLAGQTPTEEFRKESDLLYAQRLQLSGYVSLLHRRQSMGCSLYDCIDRYLSIPGAMIHLPNGFVDKHSSQEEIDALCDSCFELENGANILGMEPANHPLHDLIPKNVASTTARYASYNSGGTLEEVLPTLPQIVANVSKQFNSNLNRFANKTPRQYLEGDYKWKKFAQLADIDDKLYDDLEALSTAVERWINNIDKLPKWRQYTDSIDNLRQLGLGEAVEVFFHTGSGKAAKDSFLKGYYYQAAQSIIEKDPSLSDFNGLLFEQVIEKYNNLIKEFQRLTRAHVAALMSSRIPVNSHDPALSTELTLLRKRIANKGRGTSIRNIIDQMPHLLPMLCPVMLMSPLSVAQYIDLDGEKFDLVIFDEASQLPTCEAVGSIARAKAMIVVGDPKQMPPTSFFSNNVVADDEIESDDLESILDDCIALSMPSRYLKWHYRSNHESLIAFSNMNYYSSQLVTFPSVDNMVSHVNFHYVEGIYDYGKTRTNRKEAEAVVDEVIKRMQTQGLEKSIGIISFNKNQADLIEDLLNEQLAANPDLFALNQKAEEPIFIKNLENAQGDERDIILFSVGYGPDKEGKMSLNFGPLNQMGGERRLNVAVSRSRYEMMVFASFQPELIDESRTNSEGAIGLKRFMEFARGGNAALLSGKQKEPLKNQMMQQIAQALEQNGYEVHMDVGTSSFRIDLAVVDPVNAERYILGIICDGERYYGLKTTRDRESVQPSVLHRLGWNLMHVWSLDWFRQPDMVMKQILKQIK